MVSGYSQKNFAIQYMANRGVHVLYLFPEVANTTYYKATYKIKCKKKTLTP